MMLINTRNSTLCILVPKGIWNKGRALPIFIGAVKSDNTVSPVTKFLGCNI